MKINFKTMGIELTPALELYATDKLRTLEKFFQSSEEEPMVEVEIGKITKHHKLGDLFRAEINLTFQGKLIRVEQTESDLYAAIDIAKDDLAERLVALAKKKNTLLRRGGRVVKGWLHGLGRPFRRRF
jgi:putative sigma-54 modulation protein